jgi:hypothetical protein
MAMFDINKFKKQKPENTRYDRRIKALKSEGKDTKYIEKAVVDAINNLSSGVNSFVIYGDPQSGKTEMMIALTAKLLDSGHKVIVILSKDDLQLLKQNLERFARSGIDPTPRSFAEIIDSNIEIGNKEWIIFCKKNPHDLEKLISKIGDVDGKVVIDDEADYATPNSKINRDEKTKINELVGNLLGNEWIYIGVTATPARLDLNNTFENANDSWVYFPAHDLYRGQDVFFPMDLNFPLKYRLTILPDKYDAPLYLRRALFSYFINVAYLNTKVNEKETNYCMLIHTSGRRVDHSEDYKQVINVFNVLVNSNHKNYEKYIREIWEMAEKRYGTSEIADEITSYITNNISRNKVVVMNSETDRNSIDFSTATNPVSVFTTAIGGNIVSRGVTFINLLSMFFTRDVKHKIQQDTYIQRARMFGNRGSYLSYFELTIPEKLFLDWHRCFVFHRLALESIKSGNAPVWLEDKKIRAVSPTSIDKTTVAMDSGEMSFQIFDYKDDMEEIIENDSKKSLEKLKMLQKRLKGALPAYLVSFIEQFSPDGNNSLAIHGSTDISKRSDVDKENIQRPRGLIGASEEEKNKYPHAIHHIKIFYNKEKKARVFYRYVGNIKFLKNLKKL